MICSILFISVLLITGIIIITAVSMVVIIMVVSSTMALRVNIAALRIVCIFILVPT